MKLNDRKNNEKTSDIAFNTVRAALGLALFGVGIYLTIQANIGVSPWDCFYLGLQELTGVKYGNISVIASLIIIIIDYICKERIGIGTLTDAFIVGKTVDLCNYLDFVPEQDSLLMGVVCMFGGLIINGIGQYIYMQSALCCGPRDSLLLALSKRMPKLSIGAVGVIMNGSVLVLGYLLGGPIGVGTIIYVLFASPIMQAIFRFKHFVPEDVKHQSLLQSFAVIIGKHNQGRKSGRLI